MNSPIRVWRLTRKKYADTAFSGKGAGLFEGRWNPQGIPMVYASENISLALLETLIHIDYTELDHVRFILFSAQIPAKVQIRRVALKELPADWKNMYPFPKSTQEIGRRWIEEGKHAVLAVPSVVVPQETNYLLNPAHKDFEKIAINAPAPFKIDSRLIKGQALLA